MKEIKGYLIGAGIILLVFVGIFFIGYRYYPLCNPCPQPVTETIIIRDTVVYQIIDTVPFYIVRRDSVIIRDPIPFIVDTAAILADFYALHYYTRTWEDSLLLATSEDAITENRFVDNVFNYKIKRPAQVIYNSIDNSISYSRYLYGALSVPLNDYKFASGSVYFASERLLLGVGYIPYHKSFNATAGFRIVKLR